MRKKLIILAFALAVAAASAFTSASADPVAGPCPQGSHRLACADGIHSMCCPDFAMCYC